MSKVFLLNTHDLPRRAGEMKEYHLALHVDKKIGIDVISVPEGVLNLELRLESVAEGVLATGDFDVIAKGECIRCLEPIELELSKNFQELYAYKADSKYDSKYDSSEENQLLVNGDVIDLEAPIRDAIILALPINPVCNENCLGLCPVCGQKWALLPDGHVHEQIDARWSDLQALFPEKQRDE